MGTALSSSGRKLKQREAVFLKGTQPDCRWRGEAPPGDLWRCGVQLGPSICSSTEAKAGTTDLSEVRRSTAQSEATCLAWKLAPCTLTPNNTRSLPYTSSVPWNLSWAGVQTAAPWQALGRKQFQEESWPSDSAAGFMSCPGRTVWLLL